MKQIKMIFSYFGFLSRSVLKRKSLWIVTTVLLLCSFVVALIPIFISNEMLQEIFKTITLTSSVSIQIFTACFLGILSFLIPFKDGENDGMELLIASKPITRLQIILSRIIFFIIISIFVGLVILVLLGIIYAILNSQINFIFDVNLYLFGTSLASVLGFLIFGFIAATISQIASGKATRILSMSAFAISQIIATYVSFFSNFIDSPIVSRIQTESTKVLNENFKNHRINELREPDPLDSTNSENWEIQKIELSFYRSNITSKYKDNILYGNIEIEGIFVYGYSGQTLFIKAIDSKLDNIWDKVSNNIGNYIAASGLTAVNYLNPISALINSISDFKSLSFSNTIPYNIYAQNLINEKNVFKFEAYRADPSWGVSLTWLGILLLLGSTVTFAYLRKDFK